MQIYVIWKYLHFQCYLKTRCIFHLTLPMESSSVANYPNEGNPYDNDSYQLYTFRIMTRLGKYSWTNHLYPHHMDTIYMQ